MKVTFHRKQTKHCHIGRDVVLEAAVSARGRLKAVFQTVSPWLCLDDPAALAWLSLELSASASARSHDFCLGLGSAS